MNKAISKVKNQKIKSATFFPGRFNLSKSYVSFILGILVVIFIFLVIFLKQNNKSDKIVPINPTSSEISTKKNTEITYTVLEGDSLWDIAEKKYNSGFAWVDIAKENKLADPNNIAVGTILSLSESSKIISDNTTAFKNPKKNTKKITGNSYSVVEGDYLWNIAMRAYGDGNKIWDLAQENGIWNVDYIQAGTILVIPR